MLEASPEHMSTVLVVWKNSSELWLGPVTKWHKKACSGSRIVKSASHLAGDHALGRGWESASSDRIRSRCKDTDSGFPLAARKPRHRRRQSWGT